MKKVQLHSGSLMIELCIALAIFTLLLSSVAVNIFSLGEDIDNIKLYQIAQNTAQQNLKNALASTSNSFHALTSISSTSPPFIEHLTISDITPCKKRITSTLEWQTGLRNREIEFSAYITDPLYAKKVGGDCDGIISTTSPQKLFISHPKDASFGSVDALNKNTIVAHGIDTSSHLEITTENQMKSTLHFDSMITDIDAIHDYVFLTHATSSNQIAIVDMTDKHNPHLIAQTSLPGVMGSFPGGRSLIYYDNRLYIGTHRTAGHEFHIFDVTDRANPIWLGSREINHNINQIIIRDGFAYLATSGNIKDVIILDVSNPTSIRQVHTLELTGSEDSQCLFYMGNLLYVGRSKAKSPIDPEFIIVDISNPAAPDIVGSLLVNGTILSLKAHHTHAYLLLDGNPSKLLTIDISNSENPVLEQTEVLPNKLFQLDYEENILYGI
jgi:hypothetical protein